MSPTPHIPPPGPATGDGPAQVPWHWILLLAVPGAALAALAISAQTYLSMLGHGHSFRAIFAWQLSCWTIWALAAPPVVLTSARLATGGRERRRARVRLLPLGIGLVSLHIAVASQLTVWFQPYVPFMPATYTRALTAQSWALLPIDILAFALLVLVGWALAVHSRARWLEIRESRLEADLARAHLEALRLEIQPHFLFNTLNGIAALIRRRANDRALDMLLRLSGLMRHTLDRTQEPLLLLDAELEFTRQYVDLQQARFSDRLQVAYAVEDGCRASMVPTFLFQPLVENAIRHGAQGRVQPCHLEIGAALVPGQLMHVWVSDDGAGLAPGFDLARDARTGLGNIRSRLHQLYGSAGRISVTARDGGGTRVDIHLPVTPAARPAEASA